VGYGGGHDLPEERAVIVLGRLAGVGLFYFEFFEDTSVKFL
jgi:hypothetical protein